MVYGIVHHIKHKRQYMSKEYKPTRKQIWMTSDQLKELDELKKLTGLDMSNVVRTAMTEYLKMLKK